MVRRAVVQVLADIEPSAVQYIIAAKGSRGCVLKYSVAWIYRHERSICVKATIVMLSYKYDAIDKFIALATR